MLGVVFSVMWIILIIFVLVDVITRDQSQIRYLDKVTWVFIVIFIPLVGMILWFSIGRLWEPSASSRSRGEAVSLGDPRRWESPSAPAERSELEAIEREIQFHEKQARIRRLEAELAEKRARRSGNGPR